MSEPFDKLLRYAQKYTFFDQTAIGRAVFYEDLGDAVHQGLNAVNERILSGATPLIVDVRQTGPSPISLASVLGDLRSVETVAATRPHPGRRYKALRIALRDLRCAHSRPALHTHIACGDLIRRLHASHGTHAVRDCRIPIRRLIGGSSIISRAALGPPDPPHDLPAGRPAPAEAVRRATKYLQVQASGGRAARADRPATVVWTTCAAPRQPAPRRRVDDPGGGSPRCLAAAPRCCSREVVARATGPCPIPSCSGPTSTVPAPRQMLAVDRRHRQERLRRPRAQRRPLAYAQRCVGAHARAANPPIGPPAARLATPPPAAVPCHLRPGTPTDNATDRLARSTRSTSAPSSSCSGQSPGSRSNIAHPPLRPTTTASPARGRVLAVLVLARASPGRHRTNRRGPRAAHRARRARRPLGLYDGEIDPASHGHLGDFPQAVAGLLQAALERVIP